MEPSRWGQFSFELAIYLVDNAPRNLANHQLANAGMSGAMRLTAGFGWNKKPTRHVKSDRLSVITQRAARGPETEEPREALRSRLHAKWFAPPELPVGNPSKWRNLIATSGLSSRAPEDASNKPFSELGEMLIFAPDDLAEIGAHQLQIIPDNQESHRLPGKLRRAVKAPSEVKAFIGRDDHSIFAS